MYEESDHLFFELSLSFGEEIIFYFFELEKLPSEQ